MRHAPRTTTFNQLARLRSRVVWVQRCRIPTWRAEDTKTSSGEIRTLMKRITDKFGPEVIDYAEGVRAGWS